MKINKDLVDAVMMLAFVSLVLIGTTSFEDMMVKDVLMGSLGVVAVIMIILRIVELRQHKDEGETSLN